MLRLSAQLTALLLALVCLGCTGAPGPVAAPPPVAPAVAPEPAPPPPGLHWVRTAAEYAALTHQVFALAAGRLEALVAELEPGSWVVSLDGDETVIDNSLFEKEQFERKREFDEGAWEAWCRRREAGAVPGARGFLERVRELGGRIAIVSNRSVAVQEDTEANLRALGLPFDVVLLRSDTREKEPRWEALEAGAAPGLPPLEVVMWLGDSTGDFPHLDQSLRSAEEAAFAPFGDRWFVLPNPLYGAWQANPFE